MKKWSEIYSKEQINQYRKFKKISEYAKAGSSHYYSSGQIRERVFTFGVTVLVVLLVITVCSLFFIGKERASNYFYPVTFNLIVILVSVLYYTVFPNVISHIYNKHAKSGTEKALRLLKSYPLYTPESKAAYKQLQIDIINLSDEDAVSSWVAAESSNMEYMKANEKLKVLYQSDKKDILDRKLK